MKNKLKKISLFTAFAFVLTVMVSWKPDSRPNVFSRYLESKEFLSISERQNKGNVEQIFDWNSLLKKKLSPSLSWSMTQQGDPYLDANLKITVDGVEQVFAFTDDEGYIYYDFSTSSLIEIDCPIYDQWEADGIYHLVVTEYDPSTSTWTTPIHRIWHEGPANTPDTSSFYISFTPTPGHRYYITLTATS